MKMHLSNALQRMTVSLDITKGKFARDTWRIVGRQGYCIIVRLVSVSGRLPLPEHLYVSKIRRTDGAIHCR